MLEREVMRRVEETETCGSEEGANSPRTLM